MKLTMASIAVSTVLLSMASTAGQERPQDQRDQFRARSDDEKAVARYFVNSSPRGRKLEPGDNVGVHGEAGPPPPYYRSEFDELRSAVCGSDVIASGQGRISKVLFTSGETFLFTVYNFTVHGWLRASQTQRQTSSLSIALFGGEVLLEGQKTMARAIPPVELPADKAVTVFLKKVEGASTYVLGPEVGILTFDGESLRTSAHTWARFFHRPDTQSNVFAAITNASATCPGG